MRLNADYGTELDDERVDDRDVCSDPSEQDGSLVVEGEVWQSTKDARLWTVQSTHRRDVDLRLLEVTARCSVDDDTTEVIVLPARDWMDEYIYVARDLPTARQYLGLSS